MLHEAWHLDHVAAVVSEVGKRVDFGLGPVRAEYLSVLAQVPYVLTLYRAAVALQRRGGVEVSGLVCGGVVPVEGPAVVRAGSNWGVRWCCRGARRRYADPVWRSVANDRRLVAARERFVGRWEASLTWVQ
jgi:hypothetical protein